MKTVRLAALYLCFVPAVATAAEKGAALLNKAIMQCIPHIARVECDPALAANVPRSFGPWSKPSKRVFETQDCQITFDEGFEYICGAVTFLVHQAMGYPVMIPDGDGD
jgi:hypothetical protein